MTFLATLGMFDDMHRADHTGGRGSLAPTGGLARRLGGIAAGLGGRGCMNSATDSITPDVGGRSPGMRHSLRTTLGCTFLNGGHGDLGLVNGVSSFVRHLSN